MMTKPPPHDKPMELLRGCAVLNRPFTTSPAECATWLCAHGGREQHAVHDLIADWKRWSRTERIFAVLTTGMLLGLPLGFLLAGAGS